MENASKALLIAGGVLIAILILTIGVYLFATYGQLGESYEKNLSSGEIKKFNSNFIQFEGRNTANGNANITAQEIVTLYKFVKAYNEKNETSITNIKVENDSGSEILNSSNTLNEAELVDFIKNNSNDSASPYGIIYFECTNIEYDPNTGMVNRIEFKKI